jgi:hypothetical protein
MLQNCDITVEGELLVIRVDLRQEQGFTRTGGNIQIGSSCGNFVIWQDGKPHPKGVKINATCFRMLSPEEKKTGRWIPPET